jgi:hypothetical protein
MDNDGLADDRAAGFAPAGDAARRRRWWYLLFVVQVAAIVWPPLYNRIEPMWHGIPFFYWYQFLWLIVGGVLTAIVYCATEKSRSDPGAG